MHGRGRLLQTGISLGLFHLAPTEDPFAGWVLQNMGVQSHNRQGYCSVFFGFHVECTIRGLDADLFHCLLL